jgi:hypothetical protein
MTKRTLVAPYQAKAKIDLTPVNVDAISTFTHRSARLILALCKSEARYTRLRDLVEQELGSYAVKHLEELRRLVRA